MLTLLPAVDVADGQAVRLVQGAAGSETGYGDPLEAALAWQRDGASWVHLVDLDAAFGRGTNAGLLRDVVGRLDSRRERHERRVIGLIRPRADDDPRRRFDRWPPRGVRRGGRRFASGDRGAAVVGVRPWTARTRTADAPASSRVPPAPGGAFATTEVSVVGN